MSSVMRLIGLLLIGTCMSACTLSIEGEKYVDTKPAFNLFEFFEGDVKAWGIVQNRSGDVVQRFQVNIVGKLDQDTMVLDETFSYGVGDGPLKRIWTIQKNAQGFRGNADDILDSATGVSYGNAFNFTYSMDLPVDDTSYKVAFNDWFWAFDKEAIMNRAYITKFGIVMAEVTIFMQKQHRSQN